MNVMGFSICVVIVLGACLPEVSPKGQLGDKCNSNWECQVCGSECTEAGYCFCDPHYVEFEDRCVAEFGKSCRPCCSDCNKNVCRGTNVECSYNYTAKIGPEICQCISNYTLHEAPDTCKKQLGVLCNETDECTDGKCVQMKCEEKLCVGGDCSDANGALCTVDGITGTCWKYQCMVDTCYNNGLCPQKNCTCDDEGMVPTKKRDKCLPDLNTACTTACADMNAECKNGKCSCKRFYQEADSTYWNKECKKSLGATCEQRLECAHARASCLQTSRVAYELSCSCGYGFVGKLDHSDCLPEADGFSGDCEEDLQCLVKIGIKSECNKTTKKCDCKENYAYDEDTGTCERSCMCRNTS